MTDFSLDFPITMVKKEERIVTGIATADNVDKVGDVVDFSASEIAFKNWTGNIREMHSPVAVGKAISYKPIKIKDENGKEFNAIEVSAYISKGAQNTWEKVLDGTLRAFSIGGRIIKKEMMQGKMHNGRQMHVIKEYELGELSLVDNPANALATINLIKKADDGGFEYVLKCCGDVCECVAVEKKEPLKDPKGGLTAAGRRHFKQTEGANLKPGVKGPANTPEKMRRKGSFLTRFFTNPSGPMKKPNGKPTRLALSAAAWGEPVPQDRSDAARLAAKGRRLLERYRRIKEGNKNYTEDDFNDLLTEFVLENADLDSADILDNEINDYIVDVLLDDLYETIDISELTEENLEMALNDGIESSDSINKSCEKEDCKCDDSCNCDDTSNCECSLKKAAPTKREGGQDFPAAAFAYVPDPSKPSTWKLRLWDDLQAKESAAQVGRAIAALGAGFRGNKVSIPSNDLPAVKRKVLAAWKKVNKDKKPSETPLVLKFEENVNVELQNQGEYGKVKPMENSLTDNKISLMRKFIVWLMNEPSDNGLEKSVAAETSTVNEVDVEQVEETQMDIEVLKEALGSVIDQKFNEFATSLKGEVEESMNAKIDEVTKNFDAQKTELTQKLEATEAALAEQTAKVEEFAQAGAIKKSVDTEETEEVELKKSAEPKSVWNNVYLPQGLIKSLGYRS